jgi:hypothetical protein
MSLVLWKKKITCVFCQKSAKAVAKGGGTGDGLWDRPTNSLVGVRLGPSQGNYHHLVRAFKKVWFSAYNLQGTHDDEPEVIKVERVCAHTGVSFAKNLAQIPIAYLGKGQLKNNSNAHQLNFGHSSRERASPFCNKKLSHPHSPSNVACMQIMGHIIPLVSSTRDRWCVDGKHFFIVFLSHS